MLQNLILARTHGTIGEPTWALIAFRYVFVKPRGPFLVEGDGESGEGLLGFRDQAVR